MKSFIFLISLLVVIVAVILVCLAACRRKGQARMQLKVIEKGPLTEATAERSIERQKPEASVRKEAGPTHAEQTPHPMEVQGPAERQGQSTNSSEVTEPALRGRTIPPVNRGGRPRTSAHDREKQKEGKPRSYVSKPEIVCWKRERQWVVTIEIPEELLEKPELTVTQNGAPLSREDAEETCWPLKQISDEVTIQWKEDNAVQKVSIKLENYLLFKLSGRNLDHGRLVKFPSIGSYLVIAPEDWERDEISAGSPPAVPEPVCFTGYQAHFFDLEKSSNKKIAFRRPNMVIESKAPRFELVGTRLEDASEYGGPLFGGEPPRIRASDAQAWKNVSIIVVGKEGRGRERWRRTFAPAPGQTEQNLPSELVDRKSGWYFLRVYNTENDLIESLNFRFISSLKQIVLPEPHPLPSEGGHKPVSIEFMHEPDCLVRPLRSLANIQIVCRTDKTIATIPPDPTCDKSHWLVHLNGDHPMKDPVEVTLLVERIWWALRRKDDESPQSQWTDKPLKLSRADFAAASSQALWLKLPRYRWIDKVLVGFEHSRARSYDVGVTEERVVVPLREFGDCAEVEDRTREYSLKLWIQRDYRLMEGILAILPAVAPPPSRHWVGRGRKKTAIAEVMMRNGAAEIKVNDRALDDYFRQAPRKAGRFLERLLNLKEARAVLSQMELNISVKGSSPATLRQAKAVAHAIARALMNYDPRLKPLLRQAGFGGVKVRASGRVKR